MLLSISQIAAIENRYIAEGAPSLGDAYAALLARWEDRKADREECLRLLFLSWYSCSEPRALTGLPKGSKTALFHALFEHLGGEQTADPEVIFTVGSMASSFPYCCGDEEPWKGIATTLRQRYDELQIDHRLGSSQFAGRGAYGKYFEHILATTQAQLQSP